MRRGELGTNAGAQARKSQRAGGFEMAVVVIAFLVAGSVLALTGLSRGLFSSDDAGGPDAAGQPGTTLELRGSVIARASAVGRAGLVDELVFLVGNASTDQPIDLTRGRTVIRYSDARQMYLLDEDQVSVAAVGNADGDYLVEPGETYEVALRMLVAALEPDLRAGEAFKVEIIPLEGPVLSIERTTPPELVYYNDLG